MSDLISRSELIKFFKEHIRTAKDFREIIINIIPTIENQPTAYDVDKIIAELEKRKALYERLVGYELTNGTSSERNQNIKAIDVLNDAIEIVKHGGVRKET